MGWSLAAEAEAVPNHLEPWDDHGSIFASPDSYLLHPIEHPRRRPEIRAFRVKDEIVLVAPRDAADLLDDDAGNRAVSLNRSGSAIWDLCDGGRSVDDIVATLETQFPVERSILSRQVEDALARMAKLGFIDGPSSGHAIRTGTVFVLGVEDKPYFWWQVAIFLESLSGKLPVGWRSFIVVCNDGAPISDQLKNVLSRYDAGFATGTNHALNHQLDISRSGVECYSAMNRVEALSVASGHVDDDDLICLLDSDIFLYGDLNLDIMPTRCAAPWNWHIATEPFFSSVINNEGRGVDLRKLLQALGCEQPFKPGGVNVFVTGRVAKDAKYVADCYRFAHALFLLGRVAGADIPWLAEMPCFTLAMTANGVEWDLLERKEFLVSDCDEPSIPPGTLYHYYSDPAEFGRTAFRDSKWHKRLFLESDLLLSDIDKFAAEVTTDHEKYFFQLAINARERLHV